MFSSFIFKGKEKERMGNLKMCVLEIFLGREGRRRGGEGRGAVVLFVPEVILPKSGGRLGKAS